jgi:hypothetical protein
VYWLGHGGPARFENRNISANLPSRSVYLEMEEEIREPIPDQIEDMPAYREFPFAASMRPAVAVFSER